jgi:hypothetical protein
MITQCTVCAQSACRGFAGTHNDRDLVARLALSWHKTEFFQGG